MKRYMTNMGMALLIAFPFSIWCLFLYSEKTIPALLDFRMYYYAAGMWKNGIRNELYNREIQHQWQNKLVREDSVLLPFLSLPLAVVPFLPLTWFKFYTAYYIWLVFQLLILEILLIEIYKHHRGGSGWWIGIIYFLPVISAWIQGQLAIMLTVLMWTAWRFFRKRQEIAAGFLMSFFAIKPEYAVVPILVMAIRKQYKMLGGMIAGGILIYLVSEMMMEGKFIGNYWLLGLNVLKESELFRQTPAREATWNGLIHTWLPGLTLEERMGIWGGGLLAVLWLMVKSAHNKLLTQDWCVLAVIMIWGSLHTNSYDLSLLVLPAVWWYGESRFKKRQWIWTVGIIASGVIFVRYPWVLPVLTVIATGWFKRYNNWAKGEVA